MSIPQGRFMALGSPISDVTSVASFPVVPALVPPQTTSDVNPDQPTPTPRSLRVLHLVNGEHFSGAERVQSHLGRCLPEYGVTADFACVKPGRFAERLEEEHGAWGLCHRFPMRHRLDIGISRRLAMLIENGGYELLHAHTPRTAMITAVAARLADVPWVYHVHSPASRDSTRRFANLANAWIESQSLRRCSHLISVSDSLRRDCIAKGVSPGRVSLVHNGVPAIRPVRSATPLVGGRWTLGMVALMRPRKGLEYVLEAISLLAREGHDVHLRCIGPFETTEYEQLIQSKIQHLGIQDRIEQTGFTRDVPLALATLDAMVLPSMFGEGLPMVVLEAMAAALPVIATRVEGTPEAIRDRQDGLLAEPCDSQSLARAIRTLITGEVAWHSLAESAFRRHGEYFSDRAMASATASVYRKLLSSELSGCHKDNRTRES
jgi:glycosyltransferase involved in cell wall biosynthesis